MGQIAQPQLTPPCFPESGLEGGGVSRTHMARFFLDPTSKVGWENFSLTPEKVLWDGDRSLTQEIVDI